MFGRNSMVIAWSALAVGALLGVAVLAFPGYRERHRIDDRLANLDEKVRFLQERTDDVYRLTLKVQEVRRRIETEMRIVPDAPKIADLVRTLSLPVDDVTITDQTFAASTPTSAVPGAKTPMRAMPLTVDMRATFESIFALVRGAESMDRLVRISSLRLAGEPPGDEVGTPMLTATVGIDAIYMVPESEGSTEMMLKRIWIEISTDRRKLSVLAMGVAFGLLLWARVIVIARMPRQAVAEPVDPAAEVVDPGGPIARPDKPAPRRIEVDLDRHPGHDPFTVSSTHFPELTPVNNLVSDEDKSGSEPAEDQEQDGARRHAQLRALVERFRLEAVMTGQPLAVISGVTFRQGDIVPSGDFEQVGFLLAEVRPRSVILECEGYRFELAIARVGNE